MNHAEAYKVAFEMGFDPMFVTGADGIIETVNSSACSVFGYGRDELTGKHINMLLPGCGKEFPRPSLNFLDINMPVMDGWEFINAYDKLDAQQKDKIILVLLTTSLNPDDQERADKISGVAEFRNKPLSKAILMEIHEKFF